MSSDNKPSNEKLERECNKSCSKCQTWMKRQRRARRTYAQGTKFSAVAGGIRTVPLNMTGLKFLDETAFLEWEI